MINGPFTHSKILHKTIDATDCPECSHGERLYNERTVRILSPANPEPNPFHTSTLRAFSSSSQPVENLHLPGLGDPSCSPGPAVRISAHANSKRNSFNARGLLPSATSQSTPKSLISTGLAAMAPSSRTQSSKAWSFRSAAVVLPL